VAETIIDLATTHERESYVTSFPRVLAAMHAFAPDLHDHLVAKQADKKHFTGEAAEPTSGNLFHPDPSHTGVSGGWIPPDKSNGTRNAGIIAAIAIPVIAGILAWRKFGREQYPTADFQRAA
jgi:hypothetical protein